MVQSGKAGGKTDERVARKARLAAALRENLKRRKQQARQRADTAGGTLNAPVPAEPMPGSQPKKPSDI